MMEKKFSWDLDFFQGEWREDKENRVWALEGVVYCEKPSAPELQCMNFYVPLCYRNQDGSWNMEARCGSYTGLTAPVILENGIGGYAESLPLSLMGRHGDSRQFTDAGMVYVSPGARGRQTKSDDGTWIGKAPMGLCDLKAAIRYLRHNSGKIPGNTERIVSIGVSAGGAMSALLGVTGNCGRYLPYLEASGACLTERDDVFAAQCYCPIIDLEHSDMAYEWMFSGIRTYEGRPGAEGGTLTAFREALSEKLAERYVRYFNGLELKEPANGRPLLLSPDGQGGTAMEYLDDILRQAAGKYEKKAGEVLEGFDGESSGKEPVLRRLQKGHLLRLKSCPAFDGLELLEAENEEFGDETHEALHFDAILSEVLWELKEAFPEEYEACLSRYEGHGEKERLRERVFLMNPLNFLGKETKTAVSPHFRIRVGTKDGHTSFTTAMILALKLMERGGSAVDYEMVWNAGHEKADYEGELLQWVMRITKEEEAHVPVSGKDGRN